MALTHEIMRDPKRCVEMRVAEKFDDGTYALVERDRVMPTRNDQSIGGKLTSRRLFRPNKLANTR
jgi:hypothetical protein